MSVRKLNTSALRVESLETRRLLTTYVVNSNADTVAADGVLTLREAITAANINAAVNEAPAGTTYTPFMTGTTDRIEFAIGSGPTTIALTTELPAISEELSIDASTQPGYAGHPLVTLDGSNLPVAADYTILHANTSVSVRGLRLQGIHTPAPGTVVGVALRVDGPKTSYDQTVIAGNEIVDNDYGLVVGTQSADVLIGGHAAADRNVISGNAFDGVTVFTSERGFIRVQGNYIGVAADGTTPLPNGRDGIRNNSATGEDLRSFLIGGSTPEDGNVIAYNPGEGIDYFTYVQIRHNSIFANGSLGIGSIGRQPIENDPGDTDGGPGSSGVDLNSYQNYPVLSTAVRNADGTMTISGVINSNAAVPLMLDFYGNDENDPSDHGQGKTYLTSQAITTDVYGNATFSVTVPADAATGSGDYVTATATSLKDARKAATSEFAVTIEAKAAVVTPPPPPPTPPGLAINNVSVTEGNSGTKAFTFTITRSGDLTAGSTVAWATKDGTAKSSDGDYTAGSGTLAFAAGQATQTITVTVKGDTKVEADESFQVNLSNATNATITDGQGIGTIKNDDAAPAKSKISVGGYTATEGKSGTKAFTFKVTLDKSSASPVTVKFATANDSAKAGSDYTAASGTVTFAAGETVKTITVYVKGDSAKESDEKFFVYLSSPTNADIAVAKGTGLIKNDD